MGVSWLHLVDRRMAAVADHRRLRHARNTPTVDLVGPTTSSNRLTYGKKDVSTTIKGIVVVIEGQ
jgi:hypothetical protein